MNGIPDYKMTEILTNIPILTTTKHSFPEHRYKYGKQKHAIDLAFFERILVKVENLHTQGFYYLKKNDLLSVKSLLTAYYWLGVRKSELIGCKSKRYVCPGCRRRPEPIQKTVPAVPGVLKENIKIEDGWLMIEAQPRKHGSREAPLMIPLSFPYVNLIVQQWQKTEPKTRAWPITEYDIWRIVKECDERVYVHFFRFNRITMLCSNPEMSIAEICSWTGLAPQTINDYLERSGRFIRSAALKMRSQQETEVT